METKLWKQSYRLPNNLFVMDPTIFELWVMETENWVTKIGKPNTTFFLLSFIRGLRFFFFFFFPEIRGLSYKQINRGVAWFALNLTHIEC